MASGGYPGSYEKGKRISGLENIDDDVIVFHAGTKRIIDSTLAINVYLPGESRRA
jgi:phosphoribosylamine--glycine ligase